MPTTYFDQNKRGTSRNMNSRTPSRTALSRQGQTPSALRLPAFPMSPPQPPATPTDRVLRRPASMMTLSAPRSSSRLGTSSPVYRGTIHVGVRAKPDFSGRCNSSWIVSGNQDMIRHPNAGDFGFDAVFEGHDTNAKIFERSVRHLVTQVVNGYNATVFAYGMTGSGKTWTMQGDDNDPGIIMLSAELLFRLLNPRTSKVRVSYLEIYNERVGDLLSNVRSDSVPEIALRDDTGNGVRAVGLTEVEVNSAEELLDAVAQGDTIRKTSSTEFNERSSRSHAVVQVTVTTNAQQSVLYLCDLAGSEKAVVEMARRKEGAYINKSLLTLSTIISRLSQGGGGHVPYRDSKLTRLLQPSLSGHALVSVLCTVDLDPIANTETLNTLRFAAKAKNIVVVAKRNNLFDDGGSEKQAQVIEILRQENNSLKLELVAAQSAIGDLQEQLDLHVNAEDERNDTSLEQLAGIEGATEDRYQASMIENERLLRENKKLQGRIRQLGEEIAQTNSELASLGVAPPLPPKSPEPAVPEKIASSDRLELKELRERIEDQDRVIAYLRKANDRMAKLSPNEQNNNIP